MDIPDLGLFKTPFLSITSRMSLIDAAQDGKIDEVRRLLNQKVNVDATDHNGDTALSEAAREGHLEIVRLLLDAGADINNKGYMQNTPLMNASFYGHLDIVEHLLANEAAIDVGGKDTALTIAARRGHIDIVNALLNAGANVNHRHIFGHTALMAAAGEGHLEIVRLLLSAGADKDIKTDTGGNAVSYAQFGRKRQYEDIIELLKKRPASKRPSSNEGIAGRLDKEFENTFEELQCPICLLLLFQPVTLPCGHSLDKECKEEWDERSKTNMSTCPMCRALYDKTIPIKEDKEKTAQCDALSKIATPAPNGGRRRTRRYKRRGTRRRSYTRTR